MTLPVKVPFTPLTLPVNVPATPDIFPLNPFDAVIIPVVFTEAVADNPSADTPVTLDPSPLNDVAVKAP